MFYGLRKYLLPLALIYWISPIDLIPLFPADDLLFAVAAAVAYFALGNNGGADKECFRRSSQQDEDVITTTWSVIDDG